jgi:hypothetical protein
MAITQEQWTEDGFRARRRALRDEYQAAAEEVKLIAARMEEASKPMAREVRALQAAVLKTTVAYGRWLEVHCMVDPS